MKKILTVLIPVYNTEKYIKRCLDSLLLKETNNDVELLIVSDGSKDNSVNIIKEYVKVYPETIRLIEKENAGHGSTINVGIKEAKGKWRLGKQYRLYNFCIKTKKRNSWLSSN